MFRRGNVCIFSPLFHSKIAKKFAYSCQEEKSSWAESMEGIKINPKEEFFQKIPSPIEGDKCTRGCNTQPHPEVS